MVCGSLNSIGSEAQRRSLCGSRASAVVSLGSSSPPSLLRGSHGGEHSAEPVALVGRLPCARRCCSVEAERARLGLAARDGVDGLEELVSSSSSALLSPPLVAAVLPSPSLSLGGIATQASLQQTQAALLAERKKRTRVPLTAWVQGCKRGQMATKAKRMPFVCCEHDGCASCPPSFCASQA